MVKPRAEPRLTLARLRGSLEYAPDTGVFRWRPTFSTREGGKIAGHLDKSHGYRHIRIDREPHLAHRLAVLWMSGEWPPHEVDHIDMDHDNNRWANLRSAAHNQNGYNKGKRSDNKSGYKWVCWQANRRKWKGQVSINGVNTHVGLFDDPLVAHEACRKVAERHHGEFMRAA